MTAPRLSRWLRACGPRRWTNSRGRSICWARGRCSGSIIESDEIPSMIFWGPPGVGKTTLARIIARRTQSEFIDFSAVTSGVKEITAGDGARRGGPPHRVFARILFVDEIHRFNKAQQDAFLPFVEKGSIVLIGATTENPSFEVNAALLSRCKVFVLQALTEDELTALLRRALTDKRGLWRSSMSRSPDDLLAAHRASLPTATRAAPCPRWRWRCSTAS